MRMEVLEVNHLVKSYSGKTAVNDLSFSVVAGETLGLIGPNGAGKSSTVKMILDLIRPDSGKVDIFGHQMNEDTKNLIGYLPEERGLYNNLSAIDVILYLATLKGMDKALAEKKATVLLQQAGMLENKKKKIKHMSKGMMQIIQFIVTIIHDPKLLIMDEPFSGLDPVNTVLIKDMIGDMRDEGKAIILSTHQMNQVEELCDRVLMIKNGSEVLSGDLKNIKSRFKEHSVQVNVDGEIGDLPGVIDKKFNKDGVKLILAPDTTPQSILDQLRNQGLTINRFEITTPTLNEIFLHVAREIHE